MLEFVIIIFFAILIISSIILAWLWRLGVIFGQVTIAFFRALFTVRWGIVLTIAFLLFGAGLLAQEFQEESMQGVDIGYECGISPASQGIASFLHFIVTNPYRFIAENWNDIVIFVIEAFKSIIEDIKMLIKLGQIPGMTQMIQENILGGLAGDFWDTVSVIANIIEGFFVQIAETIACLVDVFLRFLTSLIVTRTFINQDCTYCALDPPAAECTLRQKFQLGGLTGAEPNCEQCHDWLKDFATCIGAILDYVTLGLVKGGGTSIERILRSVACIINSIIKPAFWIVQGLIDNAVNGNGCVTFSDLNPFPGSGSLIDQWFTSTDCGKPSGCNFPPPETDTDIPIGIIPCFTEFLRAVTGDVIDDIFQLIFAFIFQFIQIIITSIENIVICFENEDFKDCLENYPTSGLGRCDYNTNDELFEFIVPDGGIFECFDLVGTCLDNATTVPLLIPLGSDGIDILGFLFKDFWRFTVDLAVCPFATLIECFIPDIDACPEGARARQFFGLLDFYSDAICALVCIDDNVPPLSFIAGILASALEEFLEFFLFVVGPLLSFKQKVEEAFNCISEIGGVLEIAELIECFGDLKKREILEKVFSNDQFNEQEKLDKWKNFLYENGVYNESTCGRVLHNALPGKFDKTRWGDYSVFWGCYGMYAIAMDWKMTKNCPDKIDVGGLMDFSTFFDCMGPVSECLYDYSKNKTQQQREEFMKRTDPIVKPISNIVSVIRDYRQGVTNGTIKWSLIGDIISPMWQRFKESKYYLLTTQFGRDWMEKRKYYDNQIGTFEQNLIVATRNENTTAIILYEDIQDIKQREYEELHNLYLIYVNEMLFYHRTVPPLPYRKRIGRNLPLTIAEQFEGPIILRKDLEKSGVFSYKGIDGREYKTLTMEDLEYKRQVIVNTFSFSKNTTEKISNYSKIFQEMWSIIYVRYDIEYWPFFQKCHALFYSLKTGWKQNNNNFWDLMKGKNQYLISDGFVHSEKYETEMKKRDVENKGSLLDIFSGNYNVRKPQKYIPFPILAENNITTPDWMINASIYLGEFHQEKQLLREKRKAAGLPRVIRGESTTRFDTNQIIYGYLDWILRFFFGTIGNVIQDFVSETIDFFAGVDLEEFFLVDVQNAFLSYFTCSTPENFDGTELYSPWCLFLLREDLFDAFTLVPNDVFPLQIQWPAPLILEDCVNPYNGNNNLFEFELSDGCKEADGQNRPFCPDCDNCRRQYSSCLTATCLFPNGTRFELDTVCENIGGDVENGKCKLPNTEERVELAQLCTDLGGKFEKAFGDVLDTLLYILAVIPKAFQQTVAGGISLKSVESTYGWIIGLLALGVLTIPFIGVILYVLIVGLAHINIWTLGQIFGSDVPVGFIILVVLILILLFVAELSYFFALIVGILVFISLFWIISLIVDFPNFAETLNIIQGLIDFFTFLDEFPLLFFINFQPLLARLEEFNFGTDPIPAFDTFCFFWNFSNFGFFIIVAFVSFFTLRLLFQWIFVTIIFILTLIAALLTIRRRYRIWRNQENINDLQDEDYSIKTKMKKFQKELSNLLQREIAAEEKIGNIIKNKIEKILFPGSINQPPPLQMMPIQQQRSIVNTENISLNQNEQNTGSIRKKKNESKDENIEMLEISNNNNNTNTIPSIISKIASKFFYNNNTRLNRDHDQSKKE